MKKLLPIAAVSLFFLWSCSDSSLFMGSMSEPARLRVTTIAEGSIVGPDASIPVRITRDAVYAGDQSTNDRLLVEILDHTGTVLAEQAYEAVNEATDLGPVRLPELEEGLYTLRTSYYDGTELVVENAVPFFVASGTYAIVGLTSYPASSYPEADGLLQLSLDVPARSDPYLVWTVNGAAVRSGYLSDTGTTITVVAPAAQGAFPVRVDLYPVWPQDAGAPTVTAPVTYRAELFVSSTASSSRNELTPRESYFALYHFRGLLRDDGVRGDWFAPRDFTARPLGSPELAARSDVFGYRLNGRSGFRVDGAVWPVYDGELSPISVTVRLLPERLPPESVVLSTTMSDTGLLTIVADSEGRVGARLGAAAHRVWSAAPLLRVGEAELVTVSIVPGDDATTVGFYAGGQLVSIHETTPVSLERFLELPRLVPGAGGWSLLHGETTIGAESGGFVGIIDELGVYFRDGERRAAISASLFVDSQRIAHGDRLVYASSFDDEAKADYRTTGGGVSVRDGALELGPSSSVELPILAFEDEDLMITMEIAASLEAEALLHDVDSGDLLVSVPIPEGDEPGELDLRLTHREGVLYLTHAGERRAIGQNADAFSGVRLSVVTGVGPEDGVARIASIVVRRDRPQIPRRLFQAPDE